MAQDLGGIYWTADIRTEGLIEGQRQVKASTAAIGKDLDKLGQSAGEAGKQMSSAGADAKKMASGVSEAARATTDAIGSYNKMSNELQKQRDAVASYIESLKRQNETLGMSATELAQYESARLGATEKDKQVVANLRAQIDQYNENQNAIKKNQAAMAALEAEQEENRATVRGLIANLEEYKNTLGMTNRELVLYKAAQAGATDADLRAVRAQLDLIDAKKSSINSGMALSKTSSGVTNALGGVGRSAGQAGIQIQQFVGQIQGGINPMVALSQQGADLGFVLGAPLLGAVVGISAALAGMMLPALFSNKDAADDLKDSVEKLGTAIKIEDGVASLTERITELAKVSESAAKSLTMQEMINATNVLNASSEKIFDSFSGISNSVSMARGAFHLYRQALDDGTAAQENLSLTTIDVASPIYRLQQLVAQLNSEFKLNSDQSYRLAEALFAVKENADGQSIQNLQNVLGDLTTETGLGNKVLVEFASGMDDAFSAASNAAERIKVAEKYLADFDGALDESKSVTLGLKTELDKLIGSLKFQAETTGMSGREVAKFVATQLAAKDRTIDLNKALSDINAYFDRIEAQEALTVKTKEQEQALKQAKTAWDSYAKSIETQSAKAESAEASNALMIQRIRETGAAAGKSAAEIQSLVDAQQRLFEQQQQQEADKAKQKAGSDVRFVGVTDQQAELTRLADSYAQQQALLVQAKDLQLLTEQEYAQRKLMLEEQTQARIDEINSTGMTSFKDQLAQAGFSLEQFQNQAIGSFAAVLSGAMSGKDAIRGLAQSILTTAIGALIKMAFTAALGQKAAVATGIATAGALSTAYATPAALVSLATMGANGPLAAAAISTTTALSQGLALGAGRLNGGAVQPGMMHPVNEDGRPEMLIQQGRQYLLPNARGEVVSAKDMQGGGNVSVMVNVQNYSGQKVDVQRQQTQGAGGNREEVISFIVGDIRDRGSVFNAITETTTAGGRL